MKGAARLTLFYIVTFAFFLTASAAFSLLRAWALAASAAPPHPFSAIAVAITSLVTVVPLAVYGAVLSSFTYSSRHGIGRILSTIIIFVFSSAALFGFSFGASRLQDLATSDSLRIASGAPKANSVLVVRYENGSAVVFAGPTAVVAVGGAPIRVADKGEGPEFGLRSERIDPFAPSIKVPSSLEGLSSIFTAIGRRLAAAMGTGVLALAAYAVALSFLLASFRFLAGSTRWPFADFVLCAVALRGVAAYDDFLASGVMGRLLAALAGPLPGEYVTPAALAVVGFAVTLCAFLSALAGGRRKDNA